MKEMRERQGAWGEDATSTLRFLDTNQQENQLHFVL